MRLFLVAMMLALPLAGCLDAPVDDVVVEPEEVPTIQEIHGDVDLRVTQSRAIVHSGTYGFDGSNCASLDSLDRIERLTATMEWTPDTPATEQMELILNAEEDAFRVTGSSPLELTVDDITEDSFFEAFFIIAQAANPGASVAQEVHITYAFTFEGDGEHAFAPHGSCSWG